MNAKDYLESMRTIAVDLERTMGRIRRCDDQLELHGIRYDGGSFSSSGRNDHLSASVVELMEQREHLAAIQRHYIAMEDEAEYVITAIADPNKRRAAGLRYLECMTYRQIAKRMDYSPEGARNLCEGAIYSLDGVIVKLIQDYRDLTLSDGES